MQLIPKIEAFRDVEYLKNTLSKFEIHGFRPWRNDGYKWISFSDYHSFGGNSSRLGLQNNLAFYISSDIAEYAQEVKLVLNINNAENVKEAIDTFVRIALKTFNALELVSPQNLLFSISRGEEFQYDDENYTCVLKILKTTINSWSLIVSTKYL